MSKVTYNNLSEKFKKQIGWGVPLQRDEVVEFQWLSIPIIKQNGEMLPFYSLKRVPNIDSVYDPYRDEKDGGPGMVQIAYILSETGSEKDPYRFGEIEFTKADKCVITITGREPGKIGLLNYLRASNFNQSNPLAKPTSTGFLFKELEPKKTAKQKLKEINELNSCVNYINDLSEPELISLMKALKQQTFPSFEENQFSLITFVQSKPNRDKFNSLSKDVRMPIAALIGRAEELELIRYEKDPMTWIYVATQKLITQVPPQTDRTEHLVEYFHNNANGKAFKEFLEKEIEAMNANESKEEAKEELQKVEVKQKVKK